jgi:hypothetical protein
MIVLSSEWVSEWVNEWTHEGLCYRVNEWVRQLNEWVAESVKRWASGIWLWREGLLFIPDSVMSAPPVHGHHAWWELKHDRQCVPRVKGPGTPSEVDHSQEGGLEAHFPSQLLFGPEVREWVPCHRIHRCSRPGLAGQRGTQPHDLYLSQVTLTSQLHVGVEGKGRDDILSTDWLEWKWLACHSVVTHVCNQRAQEVETVGSWVHTYPWLHSETLSQKKSTYFCYSIYIEGCHLLKTKLCRVLGSGIWNPVSLALSLALETPCDLSLTCRMGILPDNRGWSFHGDISKVLSIELVQCDWKVLWGLDYEWNFSRTLLEVSFLGGVDPSIELTDSRQLSFPMSLPSALS